MASLVLLYRVFPKSILWQARSPSQQIVAGGPQYTFELAVMRAEACVFWGPVSAGIFWATSARVPDPTGAAWAAMVVGAVVAGGLMKIASVVAAARVGFYTCM